MPKIETPNLCNSTVKEKASIKTSNLWFHEGLYKLHGKSKNQQERRGVPTEAVKLQNTALEAAEFMSLPCAKAEAK